MTEDATVRDVADWMLAEVMREGRLRRDFAAHQIASRFGERFVYRRGRSLCIDRGVLAAFSALSDAVVWARPYRLWRKRRPGDAPGREQPPPRRRRGAPGTADEIPDGDRQLDDVLAQVQTSDADQARLLIEQDKAADALLADANDDAALQALLKQLNEDG